MRRSLIGILLVVLFSSFFAIVLSSCGGGGGGGRSEMSVATVSGRVSGLVQMETGALSRSANADSLAGLTVSVTNCSATTQTDSDGNFSFLFPTDCASDNLIITAESADGTRVAKKVVSISRSGANVGSMSENDTVKAIIVEKIANKAIEIYPEFPTARSALASMTDTYLASLTTAFDSNHDGNLTLADIDTGNDNIIEKTEIDGINSKINDKAASVQNLPEIINQYHSAIINNETIGTFLAMETTDYECFYDDGTPDDTTDDIRCDENSDGGLDLLLFMNNYDDSNTKSISISNITSQQIDSETIVLKEHLKINGRSYCSSSTIKTFIDNDITYTLKSVNGVWKIAKQILKTGRLSIKLELDKDQYNAGDNVKLTSFIKNEGSANYTILNFNFEFTDVGYTVIRPDGKMLFLANNKTTMCEYPLLLLAPDGVFESSLFSEMIEIGSDYKWGWVEVSKYNQNPIVYENLDIPGQYTFRYYYSTFHSVIPCMLGTSTTPTDCIVSNTVTVNIN